jgi:hypothetical protein
LFRLALILILFVLFSISKAQNAITLKTSSTSMFKTLKANLLFLPSKFYTNYGHDNAAQTKIVCLNSEAQKLPFFCKMESKFEKKFKVLFVLRAGNDDMYRALMFHNNSNITEKYKEN